MGFKVTVRKNGATHGEAHYTSEAVAVGMAKKMKNAGADVSVARCNGACCSGAKATPRRRASTPRRRVSLPRRRNPFVGRAEYYVVDEGRYGTRSVYAYVADETSDGGWKSLRLEGVPNGATIETVAQAVEDQYGPVNWTMGQLAATGVATGLRPLYTPKRMAQIEANKEAERQIAAIARMKAGGVYELQLDSGKTVTVKVERVDARNLDNNTGDITVTTVPEGKYGGLERKFNSGLWRSLIAGKHADVLGIVAKANPRRRRNSSTAGAMAASRSMAYTNLFRNRR
jgi:hypothetical protein